jgi:hypothetical protein
MRQLPPVQKEKATKPLTARYTVTGSRRVLEVSPGEVVELDPQAPQTRRLLEREQIRPAAKPVKKPDSPADSEE